jgi:hypothetical protein
VAGPQSWFTKHGSPMPLWKAGLIGPSEVAMLHVLVASQAKGNTPRVLGTASIPMKPDIASPINSLVSSPMSMNGLWAWQSMEVLQGVCSRAATGGNWPQYPVPLSSSVMTHSVNGAASVATHGRVLSGVDGSCSRAPREQAPPMRGHSSPSCSARTAESKGFLARLDFRDRTSRSISRRWWLIKERGERFAALRCVAMTH